MTRETTRNASLGELSAPCSRLPLACSRQFSTFCAQPWDRVAVDFRFFERSTDDEATAFLDEYRTTGERLLDELGNLVEGGPPALDFSPESLRTTFAAVAVAARTTPRAADSSLPTWIQASHSYRRGLYSLDEASASRLLALSFYLAKTLITMSGGKLEWGTGDTETAVAHQPVLLGFVNNIEMSPLLVTENLVRRLIGDPDPSVQKEIDIAFQTWLGLVR